MNTYFKRITLGILIFVGLSLSTTVFAIGYEPLTTIPGVSVKGQSLDSPQNIVLGIYTAAIGIGSILAVIMVIIGGIKYTTMESFGAKTDAKKQITAAFLGLILLLSSYLILKTINKDLVNFNTTLPTSDGKALEGYAAERAAITTQINDLKKNYDAANARTSAAQREAATLLTEKNTLIARYNAIPIADRNSTEAKALEAQITDITTRHRSKTEEVTRLSNEAQKLRLDGLTLINTREVIAELSEGNVEMANHALQRLSNIEQQKIEQLKKQGATQEEIKKAEAEKTYIVTKQSSAIYTTQALTELKKPLVSVNPGKIADLKGQIAQKANEAITLIRQTDPTKAEALEKELLGDIKKINDALIEKYDCKESVTPTFDSLGTCSI